MFRSRLLAPISLLVVPLGAVAQTPEYLGLAGHDLTSLDIHDHVIAVSTDGFGVFTQLIEQLPGTWINLGLDSLDAKCAFVHPGSTAEWAITAGVRRVGSPADPILFRSEGGAPFVPESDGLVGLAAGIYAVDAFLDTGEFFAVGGNYFFRRPGGATEWTIAHDLLAEGDARSLEVRDAYPDLVYGGGGAGGSGHYLARSSDGGDTWTSLPLFGHAHDIAATGSDGRTIFVAATSSFDGIRRSYDGGDSFQTVLEPIDQRFLTVEIDEARGRVYAAGVSTVGDVVPLFVSHDWGESWHRIDWNITGSLFELALDPDGNLYVAHRQEGVFRFDPDQLISVDATTPDAELGLTADRNPFHRTVSFTLRLPDATQGTVTIHDVAGRTLRTLVDGSLDARTTLTWDGRDGRGMAVAPGVYFVRASAGAQHLVRHMVRTAPSR